VWLLTDRLDAIETAVDERTPKLQAVPQSASGFGASGFTSVHLTADGTRNRAIYIIHNNQPIEHNNQKDKRKHSGGHGVGFMIINA
jgi:hypothetical protein